MIEVSVIATIYNASPIIEKLSQLLVKELETISDSYEIIFIDDRSRDDSWLKLLSVARGNPKIKCVRFVKNFGQHNAITAGLHLCSGNYVILMDGDLQDDPAAITVLYKTLSESDNQIVYVRRSNRKDVGLKVLTSKIFYRVMEFFSGIPTDPSIGTFRIMRKEVVESFKKFGEINKFIGGLFYWMNHKATYIEYDHLPRTFGRSNYTVKKLLVLARTAIIGFSYKPLHFAVYLGFFSALVSFIFAVYFIYKKIFYSIPILGYSSIIVSLFFIGGLILLVLGIIGQYIGQIYEQVKKRPEYLIEKKINFSNEL